MGSKLVGPAQKSDGVTLVPSVTKSLERRDGLLVSETLERQQTRLHHQLTIRYAARKGFDGRLDLLPQHMHIVDVAQQVLELLQLPDQSLHSGSTTD